MPPKLKKEIYKIGLLSLFNDFTADMITPLLPVYLASLGMGPAFLGIMEGLANFFSYLTMHLAGNYVDRHGKNKEMTLTGYSICAVVRVFMAIPWAPSVLAVRITDRIGKGIRTAPRDTLITSLTEKFQWGRAFGVQRAMDHTGSILGALTATYILLKVSISLSYLFLLASIPALFSIIFLAKKIPSVPFTPKPSTTRSGWTQLNGSLKLYLGVIFFSALTSPSELFLLLKMKDLGMAEYLMPMAWIVMTSLSLLATYIGGRLADTWSRRSTIALGWFLFSLVYIGFAFNQSLTFAWILLATYGLQIGIVEASERTYPIHISDEGLRATALGWYYFAYGIGLLPASLIFGLLWKYWNSQNAFLLYAFFSLLASFIVRKLPDSRNHFKQTLPLSTLPKEAH